jgi:hypothetical protein
MKQPSAEQPRYLDTTYTGGAISMDSIAYVAEWVDGAWHGRADKLGSWAATGYCESGTAALREAKALVEQAYLSQQTRRYRLQRFIRRVRLRRWH